MFHYWHKKSRFCIWIDFICILTATKRAPANRKHKVSSLSLSLIIHWVRIRHSEVLEYFRICNLSKMNSNQNYQSKTIASVRLNILVYIVRRVYSFLLQRFTILRIFITSRMTCYPPVSILTINNKWKLVSNFPNCKQKWCLTAVVLVGIRNIQFLTWT